MLPIFAMKGMPACSRRTISARISCTYLRYVSTSTCLRRISHFRQQDQVKQACAPPVATCAFTGNIATQPLARPGVLGGFAIEVRAVNVARHPRSTLQPVAGTLLIDTSGPLACSRQVHDFTGSCRVSTRRSRPQTTRLLLDPAPPTTRYPAHRRPVPRLESTRLRQPRLAGVPDCPPAH